MTRRAAGALAVAALAAGPAACGGDDGFEERYRSESGEIRAVGRDIGTALTGARRASKGTELPDRLMTLARRAQRAAQDLEGLDPPQSLTEERDALVVAVEAGAADLREIAAAARADDPRRAGAATRKLVGDSEAIRDARARLDRLTREE